jgi:hypothetical protein
MGALEKVLAVSLYPWATSLRVAGVIVWESLELLEELRTPARPG